MTFAAEDPDFQEVRIYWVIEDASRYAAVRAGEAHMADLPLDLQKDAAAQGSEAAPLPVHRQQLLRLLRWYVPERQPQGHRGL